MQDMFNRLVKHGCTDLSASIDATRHSPAVIASGGFGDVWRALLIDGTLVAIKTLRQQYLPKGTDKGADKGTKVTTVIQWQFILSYKIAFSLACRARDVHLVKAATSQRPSTSWYCSISR